MSTIRDILHGRGTKFDPIVISHAEYKAIRDWVGPLEAKLKSIPKEEGAEFIEECRVEARKRWPWWFPGVHVEILG